MQKISCFVNKQNYFIYLFIYRITKQTITMKFCINYLEYLKYLYKKIEIFLNDKKI